MPRHLPLTILTIALAVSVAQACDLGVPVSDHLTGHRAANYNITPENLLPLQVPAYSSRPTARVKLYLDFDGDSTSVWGSFHPGTTPAYTIDADDTTFSPQEIENVRQAWAGVAEAFSPFDVDVTTVDPGPLSLLNDYRIVVGGSGSWYGPPAGGVSYAGAFFTPGLPLTAYVFSANLRPDDPLHASFVAAAASHESGHGFGLLHQSTWVGNTLTDEYNRGDAVKAPIMGSSYRKRGLWWLGQSSVSPYSIQDDLYILGNFENAFGYRADDYGNTSSTATALVSGVSGVIERPTDVDFFSYTTEGGDTTFTLLPAQYSAMLDASLALYDSGGSLLQLIDTPSLGETLALSLPVGTYGLAVLSHGGYGDIGQYTLSVTAERLVPEPVVCLCLIFLTLTRRMRCPARSDPAFPRA